jgi:hypothetical protein
VQLLMDLHTDSSVIRSTYDDDEPGKSTGTPETRAMTRRKKGAEIARKTREGLTVLAGGCNSVRGRDMRGTVYNSPDCSSAGPKSDSGGDSV